MKDWEKEFDEKFPLSDSRYDASIMGDAIKMFVRSLLAVQLATEKKALLKELEDFTNDETKFQLNIEASDDNLELQQAYMTGFTDGLTMYEKEVKDKLKEMEGN